MSARLHKLVMHIILSPGTTLIASCVYQLVQAGIGAVADGGFPYGGFPIFQRRTVGYAIAFKTESNKSNTIQNNATFFKSENFS